ncbi:MAG: TonB-dependent receptor [Gammaproteobacteria bacterium]|nr:TonB-dependent receptor [Gammaproteobacteria bacterium]
MSTKHIQVKKLALAICAGLGCVVTQTALAQESQAQQPSQEEQTVEVISVTGTLIEGVNPVGSNVIGLSEEKIIEQGVTSATDVLRRIPQMQSFNSVPENTLSSSIPFEPPQIRGIGGLSGMATLVMLNGNRLVPVGPANWVDSSMIPASLLERVEVIPDGGSSIYGSDAVAGVINFIPKRNLDGGEISVQYGMGHGDYDRVDVSGGFGHSWSSGSLVTAFSYGDRSAMFGKDLDYIKEDLTADGGADYRSSACNPGNILADNVLYGLPGVDATAPNFCSSFDEQSYYPEEERYSLFTSLIQEIGDNAELDLMAYYSRREATDYDPADVRSSAGITSDNPYFISANGEAANEVAFSYEDVWGAAGKNPSVYEQWQVTPTIKVTLSDSWKIKGTLNYGKSSSQYTDIRINSEAQAAALAATSVDDALNPYDVSQTPAGVLAQIADWSEVNSTDQSLAEVKLIANGELFEVAGGLMRAAVGAEYREETFEQTVNIGTAAMPSTSSERDVDRNIKSVFGELYIPLVSDDNAMPLVQHLDVSISGRYDDYNDVGSSTNPKIAVTWNPHTDVTVRGTWGTSFHAPALADLAAPLQYELFLPFSPFRASDSPFVPDFFKPSFLVGGAAEGIKPESAETMSLGTDWYATDELKVSVTYWSVKYEDRLDQNAGFFFGPSYYDEEVNQDFFILGPSSAEEVIAKFGDLPVAGFPDLQTMFNIFGEPYVVSDQRKNNMGAYELDGLDYSLQYFTDVAWGELDVNVSGTYMLNRDKENVQGAGFQDTLKLGDFNAPISAFNSVATVGLRHDDLYVSGTLLHRGGAEVGEEDIDSYTTFNLFASYDISMDTQVTFNIDNVLDEDPPFRVIEEGVAYKSMGRFMSVGFRTKF